MKNKKIAKTLLTLCAALVIMGGFSVTAYAGGDGDIPTDDSGVIVETAEPQPLTPEGNMSLVDDIEGDAAGDKQFIVVQSRGGNYFYIVIDNAAEGENSVHFLNQVDEADLLSIIEEDTEGTATEKPAVCSCSDKCAAGSVNTACPVCSVNYAVCAGVEAEPDGQDEPQEEESGGMGGLVIFLIVALLGGGGALYYFKIMKPKQSAKGNDDLDEYDFDEYDEDEPEETDDAAIEQEDGE